MRIGKKLIVTIITLNLVGSVILVGTILKSSGGEISRLTVSDVTKLAKESARDIEVWMDPYVDAARTTAQVMEEYEQIDVDERRPIFDVFIKALTEKNPELTGVGTVWEPNALDGRDALNVNAKGSDRTGRFVPYWYRTRTGVDVQPLKDYEVPGAGDYYLVSKRTGSETVIDPYWYNVDGEQRLVTTMTAPIKKDRRVIGAVCIDLGVAVMQEHVKKIRPYEGSVAAIFSNGGLVSAHFDESRIGKPMSETERNTAGNYLGALVNAVREGKEYSFTHYAPSLGREMFFVSVPFDIGKTTTPWSLLIGIPTSVITGPVYRMLIFSIIISVVMLLVMSAGAIFIARSISKPLNRVVTMLGDVGNGDLTVHLDIKSKDEIGEMAKSLNMTLDKIRQLVLVIREKASSLSKIGTDLSANMTETASAINEITANIQSLKIQTEKGNSSVEESSTAMEKITEHIDTLNLRIDEQASSVSQSSAAIEEMLANIQSVTQSLVKNAENTLSLSSASEMGRASLQNVVEDIQGIARESEGLLEINAVMENIASQTNLLSMNAAIEAAHAGEAGKGFAVVADEIRKLAESSGEQSKTISGVLKKMKSSIDKITGSTQTVLDKFEAIDHGVRTVSEQEEHIRGAMEEQGEGSKQILEAVSRMNEITGRVKDGSTEMLSDSQNVIETSKNMAAVTNEIANGMSEMAVGADQINVAVNRVNEISVENKNNIDDLLHEVGKFKIE
jgi:methyl-accepting chemotaxis protein